MIFFGSRNYYKHDSSFITDYCPSCNRYGYLHSYTTVRCGHVYWVPVLPMGRKRIINQCSYCKEGLEIGLSDWKNVEELSAQYIERIKQDNLLEEEVAEALHTISMAGDKASFAPVAAPMLKKYAGNPSILKQLALVFDQFEMRDQAMSTYQRALAIEPDEKLEAYLKRLHQATPGKRSVPNKTLQVLPLFVAPAALLFFFASMLMPQWFYEPDQVFLVNGLTEGYAVEINDKPYFAEPESHIKLNIDDYGPVVVEVFDENDELISSETYDIPPSSPDKKNAYVINPDQMALILKEHLLYAEEDFEGDINGEESYEYYAGKNFYTFEDIHYPFEDMPELMDLPQYRSYDFFDHISLIPGTETESVAFMLLDSDDQEATLNYTLRSFEQDPNNGGILGVLSMFLDEEEVIEMLDPLLDDRPVLVEVHRMYQDLYERIKPQNTLPEVYKNYLDQEPDNNDLRYLYGRILKNPVQAMAEFRSVTQSDNPTSYAHNAIAYQYTVDGNYRDALAETRKALDLDPYNYQYMAREKSMLLANGRLDELITDAQKSIEDYGFDDVTASELLKYYGMQGNKADADAFIYEQIGNMIDYIDMETRQRAGIILRSYSEGAGDTATFAAYSDSIRTPYSLFQGSLASNNLSEAINHLEQSEDQSPREWLLAYSLAKRMGQDDVAKNAIQNVLSGQFDKSANHMVGIKPWFEEGASSPSIQEVFDSVYSEAAVLLTALGYRFPEKQQEYHRKAREASYDPQFPGAMINWILQ